MRTVVAMLLCALASPARADTDTLLARYQDMVRAAVDRCAAAHAGSEIIVCARRQADRYRVPFVGYEAGDPRGETVSAERNRLASTPKVPCGQGAIIANCGGGVGVSAHVGFGASETGALRLRPLAD